MIKRAIITAFKSFADTVEIDFSDGITSIIGPNGSGKSNIFESVRWVLGEQSAKSLRGNRMDDVIFNGTSLRKASDVAEVTLILDNTKNFFQTGSTKDEIAITRRKTRGGNSEYFIDDTPCKLRDIHALFLDSGIGSNSYSMIGQGQVEKILSAKAEERREIFEEASGIVRLKEHKENTEKKLVDIKQNLTRLEDIAKELEKQLHPLAEQSKKAKEYNELNAKLAEHEVQYLLHEYDIATSFIKESSRCQQQLKEAIHQVENNLFGQEEKITQLKTEHKVQNEQLFSIQDSLSIQKEELEKVKGQLALCLERLEQCTKQIEETKENINEIEDKHSFSYEELRVKKNRLQQIETILGLKDSEYKRFEVELKSFESNKEKQVKKIDEDKTLSVEIYNSLSKMKYEQEQLIKKEEELHKQTFRLDEKIEREEIELQEMESALNDAKKKFQCDSASLQELLGSKKEKERSIFALKEKLEKVEMGLLQSQREIVEISFKVEKLEEYIQNNEGFTYSGVKAILKLKKDGKIEGVFGAVAELLRVEKEFEIALDALLQNSMQNLVVKDDQVAKTCISYLKEKKEGKATFLPLNLSYPAFFPKEDEEKIEKFKGVRRAIQVVGFDSGYQDVFSSLIGRSIIADNLDVALDFLKKTKIRARIVTMDGEIIQQGSITGGSTPSSKTNYFSKRRELEDLSLERKEKENQLEKLKTEKVDLEKQMEVENTNFLDLEKQSELFNQNIRNVQLQLEELERKILYKNEKIQEMKINKKELELMKKEYGENTSSIAHAIVISEKKYEELEKEIHTANQLVDQFEKSSESAKNEVTKLLLEKGRLEEEHKQVKEYLDIYGDDADTLSEKVKKLMERLSEDEERLKILSEEKITLEKEIEELIQKIAEVQKEIGCMKNQIGTSEQMIKQMEEEVKEYRVEKENKEKELHTQNIKLEKKETEKVSHLQRLFEGYQLDEANLEDIVRIPLDFAQIKKEVETLKKKMSTLGSINHNAVEEYETLEARYKTESGQIKDVKQAKEDLEKMIKEVQTEMESRFSENFAKISENFKQVFGELFSGGKASLSLTDPRNPLTSSIEIYAQPPGKKQQELSLFSGGEKAFIAIAIVFSIILAKPSPYVILDEVDAALDESNVAKFAQYLRKFSNKTQFIVVTHRKGTMMVSNQLYGVTQEEGGVTKLFPYALTEKETGT